MQRFYNPDFPVLDKNFISKDKDFINQLTKVLRLKSSDLIILFNWKDNFDYIYEIWTLEKRSVLLIQKEKIEKPPLNPLLSKEGKSEKFIWNINLFQALPNKLSKIELILQKWVEVGINNFFFFQAERSQNFPISDNKKERLKKIIIEATEQSGWNNIAWIDFLEFLNFSQKSEKNLTLFFHTKNNNSKKLKDLEIKKYENINMFVWPEWGFSPEEIEIFLENNFNQIHLWENILRTETVWMVSAFYLRQN